MVNLLRIPTFGEVDQFINPSRPSNDLSQTSHCNIKGLSVREVMRIKNMITQVNSVDILTASPRYFCNKCMETQKENL